VTDHKGEALPSPRLYLFGAEEEEEAFPCCYMLKCRCVCRPVSEFMLYVVCVWVQGLGAVRALEGNKAVGEGGWCSGVPHALSHSAW
jgi:hypothetical protein